MTEDETLIFNLISPYKSTAVGDIDFYDNEPASAAFHLKGFQIPGFDEETIRLRVDVVIENGKLRLYFTEEDYTVRGNNRDPLEYDLFGETFSLNDPNSLEKFHDAFISFAKKYYIRLSDNLTKQVEEYEVIIKEILP
jgi:hypothetical protein